MARSYATGFSIGTKGYIGCGSTSAGFQKDFWVWDQTTNTWTQKMDIPGAGRSEPVGFSIGAHGYIGTGGIFNIVTVLSVEELSIKTCS